MTNKQADRLRLKKEVILYFGSFNPIHNGHTSVARYVVGEDLCDELWFVVSPQNPLKASDVLVSDKHRLRMVEIAVEQTLPNQNVVVSDVELNLPKPSYTIDTLEVMQKRYPEVRFSILGGTDMIANIGRWKSSEKLTANYNFIIYPREGYEFDGGAEQEFGVGTGRVLYLKKAPKFVYSSSDVRAALGAGREISQMVCSGVADYIKKHQLWQKSIR